MPSLCENLLGLLQVVPLAQLIAELWIEEHKCLGWPDTWLFVLMIVSQRRLWKPSLQAEYYEIEIGRLLYIAKE